MAQLTQDERLLRVTTTLGPDVLVAQSFEGYEAVSQPFEYRIEMIAQEGATINVDDMVRKPIVLAMRLADGKDRYIHGVVNRFALMEVVMDTHMAYEAYVVPEMWFLSRFSGCRIFQNKTIPEIIEKVLTDRGIANYRLSLQGSYDPKEYVVQYRETDLNFISRLMEFEGIYYYFEHSEDKHTLVLSDASASTPVLPGQATVRYMAPEGWNADEDFVRSVRFEKRAYTSKVALEDYNFETPLTDIGAEEQGPQLGEDYDYPGKYKTKSEGDRYARLRLEAREAEEVMISGRSNVRAFLTGYSFTIADHFDGNVNGKSWMLMSVRHSGRNTGYQAGGSSRSDGAEEYHNTYTAMPATKQYRPPLRTPRPTIKGTQTAIVVGTAGEEIYTDTYGRVKVQFYWDREGKMDENSSCWIRVSHAWAGKGWGAIYTPRIKQEVIVSFLEGDPDKPIITGRVYNADQVVPYALPDMMTKSTLKSMSTKGGGGFNEFRFEDKKGSEQIFIHAEKNLDIRVKNDRMENIMHDRHLIVDNDKKELIKNDDHTHVKGNQFQKIEGNRNYTCVGNEISKVSGDQSETVDGDVKQHFGGNHHHVISDGYVLNASKMTIQASESILLKVGGNWMLMDSTGIQMKGTMIKLNCMGMAMPDQASSPASPIAPVDPKEADDSQPGQTASARPAETMEMKQVGINDISSSTRQASSSSSGGAGGSGSGGAGSGGSGAGGASGAGGGGGSSSQNQQSSQPKHTYQGTLKDEHGNPMPNEPVRVEHSDGKVTEGATNSDGSFNIQTEEGAPGKVTFPKRDKDSWS